MISCILGLSLSTEKWVQGQTTAQIVPQCLHLTSQKQECHYLKKWLGGQPAFPLTMPSPHA